MARDMLPYLLAAEPASEIGRKARALLVGWDGEMDRERPEPLIFTAWYRALTRLIYADELGPLFDAAWGQRPLFVRGVLDGRHAAWCDDIASDAVEDCAGRSAAALDEAATELAEGHGDDPAQWRWGAVRTAEFAHAVFQHMPPFDRWFGNRIENGGGGFTVNAGRYDIRDPGRSFAQIHGPALRAIYDFSDLEGSLYVIAPGQSGNPLSPHFDDMLERWRDHRPFTIPTERAAVEAARTARLVLEPR